MQERSKLRLVPKNKNRNGPLGKAHHGLKIYAQAERVSMTNPRSDDESGKFLQRQAF
jgi:hypothetical protein